MTSTEELLRFCRSPAAARRRAAAAYARRADACLPGTAGTPAPERAAHAQDPELVRAVARNARTAAVANMEALVAAARQAEDVARGHREQLEAVLLSVRALDSALANVTAPSTPHS